MATRPAPAPGFSRPAGLNRPSTLPGQLGPGAGGIANRPTTRPSFPAPGLPGRPGGGGRPDAGGVQRPTTLPGQLPGGIAGNRPGAGGNRPGTGGNRPGIGGNRPDLGGNRPGNWGNRPGLGGDRPTIGGNRPGFGNGNNVWNNGNIGSGNIGIGNVNNNHNNVVVGGGGWGYPGWGGGYGGDYGWGHGGGWYGGYVNPHYNGWYNGGWGGGYGWGGGWWAPFALGAATWGLASTVGGWGYGGAYVNPYYSSMPAAVVASSPYDYSQPVVVNNYIAADGDATAEAAPAQASAAPAGGSEAERVFDGALSKFKAGDYAGALAGCDKALKAAPGDAVVHEVRALALFALGRYPESAAALNAVLAAAPGMDWTTMSGLYADADDYTPQLRKLEEFCRANPDSAAGHFVLAYHYLVGGHRDLAVEALKVVVAKQPTDAVAKRLLEALSPPASAPPPAQGTGTSPAATAPETDLVGTWKATSGQDSVMLTVTAESGFTWEAKPTGRPAVKIAGTIETSADAINLVSETAGTMNGRVTSQGRDAFEFALANAPPSAKPLEFRRQP